MTRQETAFHSALEIGALPALQDRAVAAAPSSPSVSPVPASIPSAVVIEEIVAHLGAAMSQMIPTDDKYICEHVRAAHDLAKMLRRAA